MNELKLVEKIRAMKGVRGIGDDCFVYRPRDGRDLVFTADQMIEDVHFRRTQPASSIGERALARSLSDIAAMGADPEFCLLSLTAPADDKWIDEFYKGFLRLARRAGVILSGGDLAHADTIYCDVMVCGSVARGKALLRSGARPGDAIYVSGRLGKPWDRPHIEPRVRQGKALAGRATSCMDLSDGLSIDLHRLCVESKVAAELDRVPVAPGSTLERALHGGEDYELLYTLKPGAKPLRAAKKIGTIVRGVPGAVTYRGKPLEPKGWDHFRSSTSH